MKSGYMSHPDFFQLPVLKRHKQLPTKEPWMPPLVRMLSAQPANFTPASFLWKQPPSLPCASAGTCSKENWKAMPPPSLCFPLQNGDQGIGQMFLRSCQC